MKLREYLQENGMKVTFFAGKIGAKQSLVSSWLSGVAVPTLKHIVRIEEFTKGKVRAKDLLIENTQKKRQLKNKQQQQQERSDEYTDPERSLEKPFS